MKTLKTSNRKLVLKLLAEGWRISAEDLPGCDYMGDYKAVRCMLYNLGGGGICYRVDQGVVGTLAREGAIQMTASAGGVSTYKILDPPSPYVASCAERGVLGPEGVPA